MAKLLKDLLSNARRVKGVTLRAVETATGISNAYLSQLESGSTTEPSPHKLHALAKYYGLSYAELMQAAGYVVTAEKSAQRNSFMFMGEPLTDVEAAAVSAFLRTYRDATTKKEK